MTASAVPMKDAMERANQKKAKREEGKIIHVPVIREIKPAGEKEVIAKDVAEARQYIAAIPNHMLELVSRIREIQAASLEEKAIRAKELKELDDEVNSHLNADTELLANAARRAHDVAMDSTLPLLANITIAEMLAKKPGRIFLNIPDVKDGEKIHRGGRLLAASNGKTIGVIEAYGGFFRIMTEIVKARALVPIESLNEEQFAGDERLPDWKLRLCRIFHSVLRRGIDQTQTAGRKTILSALMHRGNAKERSEAEKIN